MHLFRKEGKKTHFNKMFKSPKMTAWKTTVKNSQKPKE
jgi:aryl carrier-like protein